METDLRSRLQLITTPDAADTLKKLGLTRVVMRGIRNVVAVSASVVGRARTLRLLPDREDLKGPPNGPVNRGLYDSLEPGEMLVLDAMGVDTSAVLGDMMFSRIQARRAAGVIVDGAVRDTPVVEAKGLPVFARAVSPVSFASWLRPWESDVPIQCGGVLVQPGDWLLADVEGVVVVPDSMALALCEEAEKKRPDDAFSQALFAADFPLDDTYPLPAHMREFLPAFLRDGTLPDRETARLARQK